MIQFYNFQININYVAQGFYSFLHKVTSPT